MLRLFIDSDCDMTPELAKEYGYNLIVMPYTINGKEIYPYIDYNKFDDKNFYNLLRSGIIPVTSAINPNKYKEYFEPFFKNGDDILYVHFSEKMSGTFNGMNLAVSELLENYPDCKFYEIDTKAITIGSYNIALEISKLYKEGKTAEEIIEWSKTEVEKFAVYFFAEDLKFFQHSGRVSGLAAVMGSLVGIRPLMFMDSDGVMKTCGKVRGRFTAIKRLVQYIGDLGDDIKSHKIVIGQSDIPEAAKELERMIKEKFGDDLDICILPINPTIGSHCGPSCLGVCFHSLHR